MQKLAESERFHSERHQFAQMTRNFFTRFFENDLLSPETDFRATLSQALGLLAAPGLVVSLLLFMLLDSDSAQNWPIELIFVFFSVLVMGVLGVLEWDALMLDHRDQAILLALPVRPRTIFAAKFAALALFLLIFSVDVNAGSILLLPLEAGKPGGVGLLDLVRYVSAHAAATIGASAFTFLFVVSVQGILINIFKPKWFRRISTCIQAISIISLLTALYFFPGIVDQMPAWKQENNTIVRFFPPMWYVGLCEVLQGTADAGFRALARTALYGLAAAGGCSVATYAIAFGRYTRATLEGAVNAAQRASNPRSVMGPARSIIVRQFLRNPVERAIFRFTLQTMLRSPKHRLIMAAYIGTGLAIVLVEVVTFELRSGDASEPAKHMALLSLPLVISFFLLSGMRFVFNIPCELSANWVFQMIECREKAAYLSGVRKCLLLVVCAPLAIMVLTVYSVLFGVGTAIIHTVYCCLLSALMTEVLIWRLVKVPFACSYAPGKIPVILLLCGYWLAFIVYTNSFVRLEYFFLQSWLCTTICLTSLGCALWGVTVYRRRSLTESSTLMFLEEPEPAVRTLNLSV